MVMPDLKVDGLKGLNSNNGLIILNSGYGCQYAGVTEKLLLDLIDELHRLSSSNFESKNTDPFWDAALDSYLRALFYYVWLQNGGGGMFFPMNDVINLSKLESRIVPGPPPAVTELETKFDEFARLYGENCLPVQYYRSFKNTTAVTRVAVVYEADYLLSAFRERYMPKNRG